MAAIEIKWSELGQVAGVSLAFGVGIVVVFTLGVAALSGGVEGRGASRTAIAAVAFALCAAAAGYGLYLLIPQFH
jgi:hypothetical protein